MPTQGRPISEPRRRKDSGGNERSSRLQKGSRQEPASSDFNAPSKNLPRSSSGVEGFADESFENADVGGQNFTSPPEPPNSSLKTKPKSTRLKGMTSMKKPPRLSESDQGSGADAIADTGSPSWTHSREPSRVDSPSMSSQVSSCVGTPSQQHARTSRASRESPVVQRSTSRGKGKERSADEGAQPPASPKRSSPSSKQRRERAKSGTNEKEGLFLVASVSPPRSKSRGKQRPESFAVQGPTPDSDDEMDVSQKGQKVSSKKDKGKLARLPSRPKERASSTARASMAQSDVMVEDPVGIRRTLTDRKSRGDDPVTSNELRKSRTFDKTAKEAIAPRTAKKLTSASSAKHLASGSGEVSLDENKGMTMGALERNSFSFNQVRKDSAEGSSTQQMDALWGEDDASTPSLRLPKPGSSKKKKQPKQEGQQGTSTGSKQRDRDHLAATVKTEEDDSALLSPSGQVMSPSGPEVKSMRNANSRTWRESSEDLAQSLSIDQDRRAVTVAEPSDKEPEGEKPRDPSGKKGKGRKASAEGRSGGPAEECHTTAEYGPSDEMWEQDVEDGSNANVCSATAEDPFLSPAPRAPAAIRGKKVPGSRLSQGSIPSPVFERKLSSVGASAGASAVQMRQKEVQARLAAARSGDGAAASGGRHESDEAAAQKSLRFPRSTSESTAASTSRGSPDVRAKGKKKKNSTLKKSMSKLSSDGSEGLELWEAYHQKDDGRTDSKDGSRMQSSNEDEDVDGAEVEELEDACVGDDEVFVPLKSHAEDEYGEGEDDDDQEEPSYFGGRDESTTGVHKTTSMEEREMKEAAWRDAMQKVHELEEQSKQATEALVRRVFEEDKASPRLGSLRPKTPKTPHSLSQSGPLTARRKKSAYPTSNSHNSSLEKTPRGEKKRGRKLKARLTELSQEVSQLKDIVESKKNKRIALQFALLKSGIDLPDFSDMDEARQMQELEAEVEWMQLEMRGLLQHLQAQQLKWINHEREKEVAEQQGLPTSPVLTKEQTKLQTSLMNLREQIDILGNKHDQEKHGNDEIEDALATGQVLEIEKQQAKNRLQVSHLSNLKVNRGDSLRSDSPQHFRASDSSFRGTALSSALSSSASGGGSSRREPTTPRSPSAAAALAATLSLGKSQTLPHSTSGGKKGPSPSLSGAQLSLVIDTGDDADAVELTTPTPGAMSARFKFMRAASELKTAMATKGDGPGTGSGRLGGGAGASAGAGNIVVANSRKLRGLFQRTQTNNFAGAGGDGEKGGGGAASNMLNLFQQKPKQQKPKTPKSTEDFAAEEYVLFTPRADIEDLKDDPVRLSEEMLRCLLRMYARHATTAAPDEHSTKKDERSDSPHGREQQCTSPPSGGGSEDEPASPGEPLDDLYGGGGVSLQRTETSDWEEVKEEEGGAAKDDEFPVTPTPRTRAKMLKQGSVAGARPRSPANGIRLTRSNSRSRVAATVVKAAVAAKAAEKGRPPSAAVAAKMAREKSMKKGASRAKGRGGRSHGADEFDKFFSSSTILEPQHQQKVLQRSASFQWRGLPDAHSDPYGVQGEHPCPEGGPYTQLLDVRGTPAEGSARVFGALMTRFRGLASQLEDVDPCYLEHDERLAFWVNVYNSLLMHAYLTNSVPTNHRARIAFFSKMAFLVGGQPYSAMAIEYAILRHRSFKPPWIQSLPIHSFKDDDKRSASRLNLPEPLVSFALCNGTFSAPSVRVYSAETVHEQLFAAKVEYLTAAVSVNAHDKVILPKILDWYARDFASDLWTLLEWVANVLPTNQAVAVMNCIPMGTKVSAAQCVTVVPFNWAFRYLVPPLEMLN